MSNVDQQIRTTVDELLKAISTKNIIAEPIEVGDSVIITITKVGLGFGTGMGEGRGMGTRGNGNGAGSGMGAGGAAGVSPVAIVGDPQVDSRPRRHRSEVAVSAGPDREGHRLHRLDHRRENRL